MKSLLVAAAVASLALLSFLQFPGHTWLQQDTQIYAPILEHQRDPSVLRNDLLVQRPHVSFTLYDECTLLLQRLTGWSLETTLGFEQWLTRALGLWGVFLMATAAGLATGPALLVAALFSLGAGVPGPMVLTQEYEAVPRAFAVPLLLAAVGLIAHRHYTWAGVAAAAAFLIHPPTVYPVWALYFLLALWPDKPEVMRARLGGLVPLFAATIILTLVSRYQAGVGETQVFFSRLTPLQIQMQHTRATYLWISLWWRLHLPHYLLLCALVGAAYWCIRRHLPRELRLFVIGLPAVGMLSMPVSYLLLERIEWALMPQFQPMRALLYVVAMAQIAAAIAGVRAAGWGCLWFLPVFLLSMQARLGAPLSGNVLLVAAALSVLAAVAMWISARGHAWAAAALAAAALAPFWAVPELARIKPTVAAPAPGLAELCQWARTSTPADAVFLFPDAKRQSHPGVFRSVALRAVYADWKGGGQVNYLKELGEQWWDRWQQTMVPGFRADLLPRYASRGIAYAVVERKNAAAGLAPVYQNEKYVVYRTGLAP